VYVAATIIADHLTGSRGWRDATFSPWPIVTIVLPEVAVVHLFGWFCEMCVANRRVTAVLSRSLRNGRHVWATAIGERVRIYSIARERSFVPHL
jgi:hypothetical protein